MENRDPNEMKDKASAGRSADALPDEQMDEIAGGVYLRPMGCSCHAERVERNGKLVCSKCGREYGQLVP